MSKATVTCPGCGAGEELSHGGLYTTLAPYSGLCIECLTKKTVDTVPSKYSYIVFGEEYEYPVSLGELRHLQNCGLVGTKCAECHYWHTLDQLTPPEQLGTALWAAGYRCNYHAESLRWDQCSDPQPCRVHQPN